MLIAVGYSDQSETINPDFAKLHPGYSLTPVIHCVIARPDPIFSALSRQFVLNDWLAVGFLLQDIFNGVCDIRVSSSCETFSLKINSRLILSKYKIALCLRKIFDNLATKC